MKFKTTQKEIKENFEHVLSVPYGSCETLLSYVSPSAYTVRREGWGCDIYCFDNWNTALTTGYAPFGKKISRDICNLYERKAKYAKITNNIDNGEYMISELLYEFIQNVK